MNIPKIIVTSRYMRNMRKCTVANRVKYMGTREGIENVTEGIGKVSATIRQQRLAKDTGRVLT